MSRAELFDKASQSQAELFSEKANQAKLFAFKTEPNRAFGFSKLSYFLLFSVDFVKEFNFLVEKRILFMSSGLYLKELAKMLEISSFFVFQGNSFF